MHNILKETISIRFWIWMEFLSSIGKRTSNYRTRYEPPPSCCHCRCCSWWPRWRTAGGSTGSRTGYRSSKAHSKTFQPNLLDASMFNLFKVFASRLCFRCSLRKSKNGNEGNFFFRWRKKRRKRGGERETRETTSFGEKKLFGRKLDSHQPIFIKKNSGEGPPKEGVGWSLSWSWSWSRGWVSSEGSKKFVSLLRSNTPTYLHCDTITMAELRNLTSSQVLLLQC